MTNAQPSFTNKFIKPLALMTLTVILFMLAYIWYTQFNTNTDDFAIALSVAKVCDYVRANSGNCNPDELAQSYPDEIAFCYDIHGKAATIDDAMLWKVCLELEGVNLGQ